MKLGDSPTKPVSPPSQAFESLSEECPEHDSSLFLPLDSPTTHNERFIVKPSMLWPLALHFLGSIAITVTLFLALDDRQLYLDRRPQVKLANGTIESSQSGYVLIQSDVTTILSVSLTVLRWIAAAWAGPLCWRVIFLLAEKNGLRRRDVKWATCYGLLPPSTNFRHPLNLVSGLILILTLAHHAASPMLIGSISWAPSSSIIEPVSHPTISITGLFPGKSEEYYDTTAQITRISTFDTDVIKNFNTAWDQYVDERVFKRVIPPAAKLTVNSTVESMLIPCFATTRIDWLPNGEEQLQKIAKLQEDTDTYYHLLRQLERPGVVVLVVDYMKNFVNFPNRTLITPLLINVGRELRRQRCESSTTFLPNNTAIPYFHAELLGNSSFACLVYANVSYTLGCGICRTCRIGRHSTAQNDTALEMAGSVAHDLSALNSLPLYIHTLARLTNSLPDPANNLDTYITALFTRSYSAL